MAEDWEFCPRRVALFVDGPNGPSLDLEWMMRTAQKEGQIEIALSYGKFHPKNVWQSGRAEELRQVGVRPVDCRTAKKVPGDMTDATMMRDIYRTLDHRPEIDCFILCTGDGDFKNVLTSIRAEGRTVIVVGPAGSTAEDLIRFADRYIPAQTKPKGDNDGHRAQQRGGDNHGHRAQQRRGDDNGHRAQQRGGLIQPAGENGGNGHQRLRSLAKELPPSERPDLSLAKEKGDPA